MKTNYNTNHVMLTPKIKISESAVALKRISQLRRSGISNLIICQQWDQQMHYVQVHKLFENKSNFNIINKI